MPFAGTSSAQKVDQGNLAELPLWLKQQMIQGDANAAAAWLKGQGLSDQQIFTLQQQIQNGVGTPSDVRATGREIMPVGDLINRNMANTEQEQKNYDDLPGAQTTIDAMGNIIGDKSKRIGEN